MASATWSYSAPSRRSSQTLRQGFFSGTRNSPDLCSTWASGALGIPEDDSEPSEKECNLEEVSMNRLSKSLAIAGLVACIHAGSLVPEASAQEYGYAVISIRNTTNFTIHYMIKWGQDGQESRFSVDPGCNMYHYYSLDSDYRAPAPYIGFDADGTAGFAWQEYHLEFYSRWTPSYNGGNRYHFCRVGSYIDLYAG
jgi:hypothetical protein